MPMQAVSEAIGRVTSILQRRPEFGLQNEVPAIARWQRDLHVVSTHENGTRIMTDMPAELGGGGSHVTPGWLMRAALASCAATRIAMAAAVEQIEIETLEVSTKSRSDSRGLLGMEQSEGTLACVGPLDVELCVRISAPRASPDRLRSLIEESHRCSPVSDALCRPIPLSLRIEIDGS